MLNTSIENMADKIITGVTRKLFRNLITVNLLITLGLFMFAVLTVNTNSILFTGILFALCTAVFILGESYSEWKLSSARKVSAIFVLLVFILKLFASSEALMLLIIIDVILVKILFNRFITSEHDNQNITSLFLIALFLLLAFVDQVTNFIHPNLLNASVALEVMFFSFATLKLVFASTVIFVQSRRSALQRLKEEQFIEYSADFNNFFSHYINTPLTTVISNIEIIEYKLGKSADQDAATMVKKHFKVITEGLTNISNTTRDLAHIHYIRSEVIRNGSFAWSIEHEIQEFIDNWDLEYELVADELSETNVPKHMVMFSLGQMAKNAKLYSTEDVRTRLVVHEERNYIVCSLFNKGNIPDFKVDVLKPFQRGVNTEEGTGTGLGLSLIPDLERDYNCLFSLSNIGGYTRSQLKLPIVYSNRVLNFKSSVLPSVEPNTDGDDSTVQGYQAHT
jgi:signal transduction histidine kinase